MSLRSLFKFAVHELQKREIPFAVAGGFAADLYRQGTKVDSKVVAECEPDKIT